MPTYTPENMLLPGEYQTETGVVAANQSFTLGQVVGKNLVGKYIAVTKADEVYGVTVDPVVTDANEAPMVIYVQGAFPKRNIILPEDANVEEYVTALRKVGIYLKNTEMDGVINA